MFTQLLWAEEMCASGAVHSSRSTHSRSPVKPSWQEPVVTSRLPGRWPCCDAQSSFLQTEEPSPRVRELGQPRAHVL